MRIKGGILEKPATYEERKLWEAYAEKLLVEAGYEKDRGKHFSSHEHGQLYSELTYASGRECIPIGAGAYGFINGYLFKATNSAEEFAHNIKNGLFTSPDFQSVKANKRILMERYVIQNLSGRYVSVSAFRDAFSRGPLESFPRVFGEMRQKKLAEFIGDRITLTALGDKWQENVLYAFTSESLRKDLLRR